MHDTIERFTEDGHIHDENIPQTKDRLVHFMEQDMRSQGYVPSLDLEPQFTLDYNQEVERFDFRLSIYGVYIGKDKSTCTSGISNGKLFL